MRRAREGEAASAHGSGSDGPGSRHGREGKASGAGFRPSTRAPAAGQRAWVFTLTLERSQLVRATVRDLSPPCDRFFLLPAYGMDRILATRRSSQGNTPHSRACIRHIYVRLCTSKLMCCRHNHTKRVNSEIFVFVISAMEK